MSTSLSPTLNSIAIRPAATGFGLAMSPASVEAAEKFCLQLSKTELVPKAFRGKPDSIMVVGAMGARLGVDVFTAMAGIADINGKPCVYGDLMLAVCLNHPEFEDCLETLEGKAYEDAFTAICTAKRKGRAPVTRTFSVIEAKEANLWKKAGPWTSTPQRMLQMRARAFALRDTFADALAGMHAVEEMQDLVDVTASATVQTEPKPAKKRTVESARDLPDGAVIHQGTETTITKQTVADEPAAEQTQTEGKTLGEHAADAGIPAKDTSVAACQTEFGKLWKHSDAGKAAGKSLLATWKLERVAELAGATDDDREAFLAEVGEALAKREG